MIIKSTPTLLQFYKDWLEWAESESADLNDHDIFNSGVGLCRNLAEWLFSKAHEMGDDLYCTTLDEIEEQFVMAGLWKVYPFGQLNYDVGMENSSQHKDEKRLAWVKARIADGE